MFILLLSLYSETYFKVVIGLCILSHSQLFKQVRSCAWQTQKVEFNTETKDSGIVWKSKTNFSNSKEPSALCTDVLTPLEEIISVQTAIFRRGLFLQGFQVPTTRPSQGRDCFKPVVFCVALPSTDFLDNQQDVTTEWKGGILNVKKNEEKTKTKNGGTAHFFLLFHFYNSWTFQV